MSQQPANGLTTSTHPRKRFGLDIKISANEMIFGERESLGTVHITILVPSSCEGNHVAATDQSKLLPIAGGKSITPDEIQGRIMNGSRYWTSMGKYMDGYSVPIRDVGFQRDVKIGAEINLSMVTIYRETDLNI